MCIKKLKYFSSQRCFLLKGGLLGFKNVYSKFEKEYIVCRKMNFNWFTPYFILIILSSTGRKRNAVLVEMMEIADQI